MAPNLNHVRQECVKCSTSIIPNRRKDFNSSLNAKRDQDFTHVFMDFLDKNCCAKKMQVIASYCGVAKIRLSRRSW